MCVCGCVGVFVCGCVGVGVCVCGCVGGTVCGCKWCVYICLCIGVRKTCVFHVCVTSVYDECVVCVICVRVKHESVSSMCVRGAQ